RKIWKSGIWSRWTNRPRRSWVICSEDSDDRGADGAGTPFRLAGLGLPRLAQLAAAGARPPDGRDCSGFVGPHGHLGGADHGGGPVGAGCADQSGAALLFSRGFPPEPRPPSPAPP